MWNVGTASHFRLGRAVYRECFSNNPPDLPVQHRTDVLEHGSTLPALDAHHGPPQGPTTTAHNSDLSAFLWKIMSLLDWANRKQCHGHSQLNQLQLQLQLELPLLLSIESQGLIDLN
ncbi:unnamed protein product [[Candida] boidinii]|uniref:Unnamed protein product n=1 Tax=Candida boidinii TaxID=5477 RepID=A0A9W6T5S1_CANBO|nr:unnamed protein product [[Candida] boidinii]GMF02217.1 unnamed protein product [[Candida] boidinii]GMF81558.1 unnamed protein product [[Candida] boidinii]GMF98607.1 unnamed protein product [[Candida] boidinii]